MSVLIQDLRQSGMGTPRLNCPSKPPVRHRHTLTATLSRQGQGELLARLRLGAGNDIRALLGNQ